MSYLKELQRVCNHEFNKKTRTCDFCGKTLIEYYGYDPWNDHPLTFQELEKERRREQIRQMQFEVELRRAELSPGKAFVIPTSVWEEVQKANGWINVMRGFNETGILPVRLGCGLWQLMMADIVKSFGTSTSETIYYAGVPVVLDEAWTEKYAYWIPESLPGEKKHQIKEHLEELLNLARAALPDSRRIASSVVTGNLAIKVEFSEFLVPHTAPLAPDGLSLFKTKSTGCNGYFMHRFYYRRDDQAEAERPAMHGPPTFRNWLIAEADRMFPGDAEAG